MRQRQ
jgi:hypothetical protein